MSVTLSKQAEQFVNNEVAKGTAESPDEVIDQALELYKMREDYLARKIERGMNDIKTGRFEPYSDSFLKDITEKVKARLANEQR